MSTQAKSSASAAERTADAPAPWHPNADANGGAGEGTPARTASPAALPAPRAASAAPGAPPASGVSGAAPESEPATAASTPRRNLAPIVVGMVALALIGLFARQWWMGRGLVSTENAQVAGHVIPILPRVSGFVTAVTARENEPVKQGDVLVTIDDRDSRVRLAEAEADLQKEIANAGTPGRIGQASAQLDAARAAEQQAEANAERDRADLARARTLAPRNIISRQELDAAEAKARAAEAQLAAAHDQVAAAVAGLASAGAKAAAARAARDQAALQLSYTTLTAPASGVVSKKNVEVGQYVQAGQPLFSVVPLDDVWIVANLKETEIRGIDVGAAVEIEVDSYKGRRFAGQVESLSPATGATFSMLPPDNATGNFTKVVQRIPVRIRLDGPADPVHPLRPGMSAVVHIRVK